MISIVLPDLRGGGAERVGLDLARGFSALGLDVEFVLMRATGEFLLPASNEFSVVELNASKVRTVPTFFARYLRAKKPEAVIANMWPLTSAAACGRALSRQQCRLLLVDHSNLTRAYASWGQVHNAMMKATMLATYRMADCVAGVSDGVARDIERLAGLSQGSVAVLHNPIPQRPMPNEHARAEAVALWKGQRQERILTVGSFIEAKNHSLLLHAFAQSSRPTSTLMFVGQGKCEPMLRALAADLGVADRVVFAGFHADPSPFYATADLFVLSSDYEGLGNVIIEALSFGLPVVSTDCPSGPSEILEKGHWGRLTPVGDAEALARAMDEALSTPVDREALKRRAADFSPEIAARKYLDLLGLS